MLGLPESTVLRKIIPKKAFFAKFAMNTAEQREFDNAIKQLAIVNEISSRTIPALSSRPEDKAIYVLAVQLKQARCDDKLILKLLKLIDQRLILALSYEDKLQLALVHNKLIKDEPRPAEEKKLQLQGLSINDVWDNIALSLAKLKVKEGQSAQEAIAKDVEQASLLKEIDKLEKKMWSERQPKKKFELREQINALKQKMEE